MKGKCHIIKNTKLILPGTRRNERQMGKDSMHDKHTNYSFLYFFFFLSFRANILAELTSVIQINRKSIFTRCLCVRRNPTCHKSQNHLIIFFCSPFRIFRLRLAFVVSTVERTICHAALDRIVSTAMNRVY